MKRTEIIYLRLPDELKKLVMAEAKKNMRTITQQIQWCIEKALHNNKFTPGWYESQSNKGQEQ